MSHVQEDDYQSEHGNMFEGIAPAQASGGSRDAGSRSGAGRGGLATEGVTRQVSDVPRVIGRGPVPVDGRKFLYDRTRGHALPSIVFGASKADRMDAGEAGAMLDRIHQILQIDRASEDVLVAFDRALFFEHTINGASLLQPSRGFLTVGQSLFEMSTIIPVLGVDQRRFFRAFADEIADTNRQVLAEYDPYVPETVEKRGQLIQVAVQRGLQKYPYLAHDSSDAGLRLSVEERIAVLNSKRVVLESTVNNVDKIAKRVPAGAASVAE